MDIKAIYKKIYYETYFLNGPLSIFLNASFLIRRRILKTILTNKQYISGDVLDFGCGAKPYKNLFQYKSYIGVDVETGSHSHREEAVDIFYDGKRVPFADNRFDSVFCSEVFEHVEDIDGSLSDIFRVLKPGGHLLFTMPFGMEEHEIPYDFRRLTSFGVAAILRKHSFSIIKTQKTNGYLEAVSQLFIFYVASLFPKNRIMRLVLSLLIIGPLNIATFLFCAILPKNEGFFSNFLVVAQKPYR